jgi:uncharacterized protein YkwD
VFCTAVVVLGAGCAGRHPDPSAEPERAQPADASSADATPADALDDDAALRDLEKDVRDAVNDVRRRHGLGALSPLARLDGAARRHSEDMARRDYFVHVSPDGATPDDRLHNAGFPAGTVGENIARIPPGADLARFAVDHWMESPAHRDVLLNPVFLHTGVGVAVRRAEGRPVELLVTQVFFVSWDDPGVLR